LNQRFLAQTYEDLLQRPVDAAGLAYWGGLLDQGVSRADVIQGIENSPEGRTDPVQSLYKGLLGRAPGADGLHQQVALLTAGGTVEQVQVAILGSPEYFQGHGKGTAEGFLTALYQDVLDRAIDSGGASAFGAAMADSTSHSAVAEAVLNSP